MKKMNLKGASWDSLILAFSKALSLLFSILSAKILSTGLSLEGYGTYAQANLVMTTGTSIILLGLGDALAYYFNTKKKEIDDSLRCKIINTVFFIECVLGIILASAIVIGQDFIAGYFSNDAVKTLLPIVAILPLFSNIISLMQIMCVSIGRAKWMSIYNLVLTIIRIVAVYFAVYVIHDLVWIYVVILSMDVINIILYNWDVRKNGIKINPLRITFKYIKPILMYGLPMGIYSITSAFTRELDKLVIGRLGGTEEMAIYANCSKVLPLDFFVTSFAVVLIPYIYRRVSEGRREESIDLFSSYLKVGYYTVWILGTMALIAPESIISFLYSDAYVAGKDVFVLYIFDSMLRFASVHLILTAAGKAKKVMAFSIFSLCLNLMLNVLFYHFWGMIGPAISTLITAIIYMLLILGNTTKIINAKWSEVLDFKDLLLLLVSLASIWALSSAINTILAGAGLHIYISMIISMVVFLVLISAIYFKKIIGVLKKINSFKL